MCVCVVVFCVWVVFFLGGGGGEIVRVVIVSLSVCLPACMFLCVCPPVCVSVSVSVYVSLCMYVSLCVSLSLSLGLYRNCQLAAGPNTERPAENGPTKLPVCAVRRPAIQRFIHVLHRLSISSLQLPVATFTS